MAAHFLRPLRDEAGSQVIEFGLVLVPLLAVVFLIMDVAWLCFAQASLQHAVQMGVRAAVTGYVPAGSSSGGQDAYLKSIVQQSSMGFISNDAAGLSEISISYYKQGSLTALTGNNSNAGGNIIEIDVQKVPVNSLGPIYRESWSSLLLHATSSDVMESSPNGNPPKR